MGDESRTNPCCDTASFGGSCFNTIGGICMIRKLMIGIAAASMAFTAAPVMAQDEEEARTTYRIVYLKLKDGKEQRWVELGEKYYGPANEAAGLSQPAVHYLMAGPWDIMMVIEMPDGLSSLDTHGSPQGAAFNAAFIEVAGGEEEAEKIRAENRKIVRDSVVTYSHTHP